MNSSNTEDGKVRDPPAYWRRLFQMMATVPIIFMTMVGAPIILPHNTIAVTAAIAVIMPIPCLAAAYLGIRVRELPYYWGFVLRGKTAGSWGYVYLLA